MEFYVWLVVAAVMAVVEAASFALITMWFFVGALAAFLANMLGAGEFAQVLVFLVVSVLCLVLLRPVVVKHRNRGPSSEPTLVGAGGRVTARIPGGQETGKVETSDRMSWTARSADGTPLEAGAVVRVVAQESIKLVVERAPDAQDTPDAQDAPDASSPEPTPAERISS